MKFKLKGSIFVYAMFVASVVLLLAGRPAQAQCNVQQTAKLLAEDGTVGDWFGNSVAIDGTTAIVGAIGDDDNGYDSGSAYLFDTTTGGQFAKLLPNDGAADDQFGNSVSISGTTATVGAPGAGDNGIDSGSAYLFDTTTGQQILKLLPTDGAEGEWFGYSISISETDLVIGAPLDDDNGQYSGSVYTTAGKLLADDGAEGDWFGNSVAISGSIAIVGAWLDDDNGADSGSAYVFDTATGQQIRKLLPDDGAAGDHFGFSVAINGTTAIVGAPDDDDNGEDSGSAYLFDIITGRQLDKLLPDDGAADDLFGTSVSISRTTAIVGADQDDDNGDGSGSAYLFDTLSGQQLDTILPDNGSTGERFGDSVAISGATAIVGASTGGQGYGSAYLFDIRCGDVVRADHFNIIRGFHISGVLGDSFESDDSYLKFNPGMTINSSEAPIWLIFDGTLPSDKKFVGLEIVMESNAGTPGLTHTLEAWNWTSAAYDVVDVSAASFNDDVVVTIDLSSGISDYAQAGTGAVRTRVGWRKTGLIINNPWEVRLDQMVWIVQ